MLAKMIDLAADRHQNQYDKSGKPYILHCLKVMHYLKSDDEELNCIAVGHDLLEDTDVTREELEQLGFGNRIIWGIECLSKSSGMTYNQYKGQVKSNPDSVKVKLADLRHNSDIRRLKGITQKDIDRTRRYHEFYLELIQLDMK